MVSLSISENDKQQIIDNLIENTLEITFPDGDELTITEENILSESMKLIQSICNDSTLRFGGCIASRFEIDLLDSAERKFSTDLTGKWISVALIQKYPSSEFLYPSANLAPSQNLAPGKIIAEKKWYIFSGFIDSAKVDKNNKNQRHIIAYDVMAKLYEWDATNHLFALWQSYPDGYTVGDLFVICLNHNGHMVVVLNDSEYLDEVINQTTGLTVRDFPTMNKDWLKNSDTISYGTIIKNLCETIGLFGVIKPNEGKGVFRLISLGENTETYSFYEEMYAEEFISHGYSNFIFINGYSGRSAKTIEFEPSFVTSDYIKDYDMTGNIVFWQEDDGTGGSKVHYLNDLLNGESGKRMYNSAFTPLSATLDGRLWVNCGDRILINSYKTDENGDYMFDENSDLIIETTESFVLSRTITGIKALTDKIEAKGEIL